MLTETIKARDLTIRDAVVHGSKIKRVFSVQLEGANVISVLWHTGEEVKFSANATVEIQVEPAPAVAPDPYPIFMIMVTDYGHNWHYDDKGMAALRKFFTTGNADWLGNWKPAHVTLAREAKKRGYVVPGYAFY